MTSALYLMLPHPVASLFSSVVWKMVGHLLQPVATGYLSGFMVIIVLSQVSLLQGELQVADLIQFNVCLLTVPSILTTYLASYVRLQSGY